MGSNISNFDFLKHHDELLLRLAQTAEWCFIPDPNTTLLKMRQLGEELAKNIAARVGVACGQGINQVDLLRSLDYSLKLEQRIKDAFHTIRKLGNAANHDITSNSHRDALQSLQIGHALSIWYHQLYAGDAAKGFKPTPFVKPKDPSDDVRILEEKMLELERQQQRTSERLAVAESLKRLEQEKMQAELKRAEQMQAESKIWEQIATEQEAKLNEYKV
ncbi:DUF4145 domain-containing protein [Shewanella scandinavica]|uniref:DUF4145 domain-containing protein n=1 Tax=Shewanella scandinavica TaxID=3063538 RepID=UPI00318AD2FC